ncbi:MAG: hypothetical protein ACXW4U_09900 [Anaerolineales bacterium]
MRIRLVIVFLIGGAIIAAALFADVIGLDNDPGWGRGRIAILVFGTLFVAWGIFHSFYTEKALSISRQIQSRVSESIFGLAASLRRYWYTLPILIFVILVYIWFASSGSWTDWESATRYYADLANSFQQGKLHLLTRPDADLLKLSNPYDPLARQGLEFFIDYSLYNGKFYLYWGPVPAFILMMIDPFTRGRVGDLYLVFSFVCGIFFLQFLFITIIWDRFFRDLPKWILPLSISILGLIIPWTYLLINEPNGRVYETAISVAQFFLLGGFLIAVITFRNSTPSVLSLLFIGFLWALAIGTRLSLAVPIGTLMLMVAYRIWKTTRPSLMNFALKLIYLGLPTVLCLLYLGWYNWARFGSVTETGFSYALAGVNLRDSHINLFSPIYFVENLYSYLLQPPSGMAQFPFLYLEDISAVTGLLFVAPFTLFALLPIVTFLMKITRKLSPKPIENDKSDDFLEWTTMSLLATFSSAFLMLLIFFWRAMRYLGDFMPALAIISVFGFWQGYQLLAQKPLHQRVYSILGIILASLSIIISILFSISIQQLGRAGF